MSTVHVITEAHALLALRIIITLIALTVFCGVIVTVPEVRSAWRLWRERVAIRRRNAAQAKRTADGIKWGLMTRDVVRRSAADSRREAQQFHLPAAFRDQKGITRL